MPTFYASTTQHSDFSGLWIPLITPFTADRQELDLAALKRLLAHYRDTGISGYVVCGSTGEAAALDKSEPWKLLETVLEQANGLGVVMGFCGYRLADALAFVEQANAYALCGLLLAAPPYILPSQAGLLSWFQQIADRSRHPLLIYDIPYRTGVELTLETLQTLAHHPNIVGIKDCGGNPAKTQHLLAETGLQVLAGEDHQIFGTVAAGGCGAIAASAHVCTAQFAKVIRLLRAGDMAQARRLWTPLVPVISALFAEPNPASIKSALAQQGWIANSLRLPMQAAKKPFDLALLPGTPAG